MVNPGRPSVAGRHGWRHGDLVPAMRRTDPARGPRRRLHRAPWRPVPRRPRSEPANASSRREVVDGERRAPQRLRPPSGGAIGTSYTRCGRQTSSAALAARRTQEGGIESARVVIGLEGLRRLAGGDAPARRTESPRPGRHPRLADVGTGADDGHQPAGAHARQRAPAPVRRPDAGRDAAGQRVASSRLTSSSLCAADSVTRSRLVPTGTVGGRMAGTHRPSLEQRRRRVERRLLAPSTIGTIGLGCPAARVRPPRPGRSGRRGGPSGRRLRRSARSGVRRAPPRRRPAWARSRRCRGGPG